MCRSCSTWCLHIRSTSPALCDGCWITTGLTLPSRTRTQATFFGSSKITRKSTTEAAAEDASAAQTEELKASPLATIRGANCAEPTAQGGPADGSRNERTMPETFLARMRELNEREAQEAKLLSLVADEPTPRGRSALQGEVQTLATAVEGSRNDTLNRAAFNLGQLVGSGDLPDALVVDELTAVARQVGLADSEIHATIKSGMDSGAATPRAPKHPPTASLSNRVLTRSDLNKLSEPKPLMDNVLDQGTTALLYGKWGTAKSFIALDWAASVATGRPWQGRETRQRKALYVAAEGAHGFKSRTDAWEAGWNRTIDDQWFHVLPAPVNLTKAGEVGSLTTLIRNERYGFVVVDTLARSMVGADENSAKDCGVVVDALTRLVEATPDGRGVVLGVHHAGKDGKTFRGSSAFEAGADTVYFTKREGNSFALSREKRKDGPQEDRHLLKLDPMAGTNSCVMSTYGPETAESRADVLRLIVSQHFVSTGVSRTDLRQMAVDEGPMSKATFFRALTDLLECGYLINIGTDQRPFYTVCEPSV